MPNFTSALQNAIDIWTKRHASEAFTAADIKALTPGCSDTTVRRFLNKEKEAGRLESWKGGKSASTNMYKPSQPPLENELAKELSRSFAEAEDRQLPNENTDVAIGDDSHSDGLGGHPHDDLPADLEHVPGELNDGNATIILGHRTSWVGLDLESLPLSVRRPSDFSSRPPILIGGGTIIVNPLEPSGTSCVTGVGATSSESGLVSYLGRLAIKLLSTAEEQAHDRSRVETFWRKYADNKTNKRGRGLSGHSGHRPRNTSSQAWFRQSRSERRGLLAVHGG